jgi:thiamine-phosphate pyrophosphorylase
MICLVTDRRRLLDGASPGATSACLVEQVRRAVDAAVDLVQVRERDLEAASLAALMVELLAVTRGTATRLVVNDRIDVAIACGADGVHLRGDSISIAAARQLAPAGFLVGRSVHGRDEAIAAAGADYLIAGTVFRSASKGETTALIGIRGLQAIVQAVDRPVLAIGGIGDERIDEIANAGAAGIAAIGLFMAPPGGAAADGCRAIDLRDIVHNARSRFDRLNTSP